MSDDEQKQDVTVSFKEPFLTKTTQPTQFGIFLVWLRRVEKGTEREQIISQGLFDLNKAKMWLAL